MMHRAVRAGMIAAALALAGSAVQAVPLPSGTGLPPLASGSGESSHVFKVAGVNNPGLVWSVSATNLTATAGFLVLINAATAPGDGAITPLACAPLPANSAASITYSDQPGLFGTGVTAVVSSANTCLTKTTGVITAFFSGIVL